MSFKAQNDNKAKIERRSDPVMSGSTASIVTIQDVVDTAGQEHKLEL
jgi:hypothetical protein